jgi:hypothetical protein
MVLSFNAFQLGIFVSKPVVFETLKLTRLFWDTFLGQIEMLTLQVENRWKF